MRSSLLVLLLVATLPACSDGTAASDGAVTDRSVGRDARAEASRGDGAADGARDGARDSARDRAVERPAGEAAPDGPAADTSIDAPSADTSVDTTSADTSVDTTSTDTSADTIADTTSPDSSVDSGGITVYQQCGPSASVLCNIATEVCVISAYQTGLTGRCLTVPSQCLNDRTCACLTKQVVCQTSSSFIVCSDGSQFNKLYCSCPAC